MFIHLEPVLLNDHYATGAGGWNLFAGWRAEEGILNESWPTGKGRTLRSRERTGVSRAKGPEGGEPSKTQEGRKPIWQEERAKEEVAKGVDTACTLSCRGHVGLLRSWLGV